MLKIQTSTKTKFKICDAVQLGNGIMCPVIQGQCSEVEVISQNGYRYRGGFWDRVLKNEIVIDSISSRDMFGMIEHPEDDDAFMRTPYKEASHVVLKAWCDKGNPFAQFGILNNTEGNALKALVDIGHKPGVSTRGLGAFGKDDTSQFVDEANYGFITWDIVNNPNFAKLKMDKVTDSLRKTSQFEEFTEMFHLRDSVDESYNRQNLLDDMEKIKLSLIKVHNYLQSNP